jgi:Lon-like ATP-dependent protease
MLLILHVLPIIIFFFQFFFRNESDVVSNLTEVYPIGTFAQIHEIQDLGDRLRLVVMAHRRIRLLGQIVDDSEAPPGKQA